MAREICCGNGCKNCPYNPKHTQGTIEIKLTFREKRLRKKQK